MRWRASEPRRARPDGRATGPGPSPGSAPERVPATSAAPVRGPAPERATHRLYVQIAWTTLDGLPLVPPDARGPAEARLISLCRRLDVEPVAVRVTASDVALLARVKPSHAIGGLATTLKLGLQDVFAAAGRPVRWSRGFAASSVGPSEVRRRARRIRGPAAPPGPEAPRPGSDERPIPPRPGAP